MSELNLQTQNIQAVDLETKSQLAKVKKLITANNADSFALAVELVGTLGLDNEATWLSLLAKSRIAQLVKLADSRVTNLLLEIAGTGRLIGKTIFGLLPVGGWLTSLSLDGLTSLSARAAQALSQHEGELYLNGLTSLSDAVAQALAKHKGARLSLDGLTSLSDAVAQALGQHNGGSLCFGGLKSLSDSVAQKLAKYNGQLSLNGLASLSNAAALALSQHKGGLNLLSLTSLNDSLGHVELAKMLARGKSALWFRYLTSLSDGAAQALGQHKEGLLLDALTSLSEGAAQALVQHKRQLSLRGLTSLSDGAAEALSQHKGNLGLSAEAARGVERVRRRLTGARLFEFEEGGSSKFWDTQLRGTRLVTRFGGIGSTGQEKVKTFPDAAAAAKEQAKLIKEKTGKGYQEF